MSMLKKGLVLCLLVTLSMGCGKKEEPVVTSTPAPTATPEPLSNNSAKRKTEEVGRLLESGDYESLSMMCVGNASVAVNEIQQKGPYGNLVKTYAFYDGNRITGTCDFESGARIALRYDEDLNVTEMIAEQQSQVPELTNDRYVSEQLVYIGNQPQILGILTIPNGVTDAPVALLLPERLDDDINGSGSDITFRKDLAYELAKNGVTSLRFETRMHADPSVCLNDSEHSLGYELTQDVASAIHMLDHLPVDAGDITILGIGQSAVFASALVYQHFEVQGGLVLMDLPEKTGLYYLAETRGLSETQADEIVQKIKDKSEETELYGLPMSYWKEWYDMDQNRFLSSVKAPVLLLNGEKTGDDTIYKNWYAKLKTRSRFSARSYAKLNDCLRGSDWLIDAKAAKDLAVWIKTGTLPKGNG